MLPADQRVAVRSLGQGVFDVVAHYGFMEDPNVPEALTRAKDQGLDLDEGDVTYFLGRETLIPTPASPAKRAALSAKGLWMAVWRKRIFMVMTNNSRSATAFFGLPPNRVIELGAQVQI